MTNAWDAVRTALDAEDAAAVAKLVTGLDDARRREVARELPGYLKHAQRTGEHHPYTWAANARWTAAMRVAGAGTIPGATATATWLARRDLEPAWEYPPIDDVPSVVEATRTRPAAWREDLAVRLALKLRSTRPEPDQRVRLTLALLRETGVTPPDHDPLTLAWIAATPAGDLHEDPLLNAMVPRLFSAEGVGRLLRNDADWPATLATLADGGRIEREALLSGCRTRFLVGGQAIDQRFFVRLHELLDPSDNETAPHLRDYLALLPSAPANVADLALKRVRRTKAVPPGLAGEAVEGLLFRAEGRLVRAGLAWLDRLLRDTANDLDAYAPALAAALVCESGEARSRAVKLAVKHADRFGPLGVDVIRDTVALLPPDHGAELAAVFGGEPVSEPRPVRFVPPPLRRAPEPAPMPLPMRDPEELARMQPSEYDWLSSERWLDGFVTLAATRRAELTTALKPLARRCGNIHYRTWPWWNPSDWAIAMARELAEPGSERAVLGRLAGAERVPEMTHSNLGLLMPLTRYAEVYRALADDRLPPYLLSTPTRANGLLDAEALVERLEGYERAAVEALPLDLRQALLRLRRDVSDEVAARAGRLTSEAGRRVARWLTNRPADPEVVFTWTTYQGDPRIDSEFVCGPEYQEVLGDLLVSRFHDESCERLLAVLAGHRDLAAARAAWTLLSWWPLNKPKVKDLALLASADGPAGPGVGLILARFLLDGPDGGAVPPLLRLAATGRFDGRETGRQLAVLLRRHNQSPGEAVAALREAAERGAHQAVWQVMAGLLPDYLPKSGERATTVHTRLMAFAADVAEWADARGELAVVAELAGRARGSELVRLARRLHDQLTGPSLDSAG
ncbi:DUF6493 family protein [Thermoactinospora rubra]|uniref:DUF7824 domain-containing protein n=1 Tax=Thermoactinospora rubra TaxID=1088767 RepID=UPI000A10D79C|nr:DUF6493 family protein [Thermoactinospora rubra]